MPNSPHCPAPHTSGLPTALSTQRGFSLVELLTVVALMTLLVSLGVNSIAGHEKTRQMTAFGNRITNLAYLAREKAISRNTPCALVMLRARDEQSEPAAFAVLMLQDD